jgi:hypothetical protein
LKGFDFRSGPSDFAFRLCFGGIRPPRRIWLIVSFGRMNWRMGEGFRDRDDWKGDGRGSRRRGLRSRGRGISIVVVDVWLSLRLNF